MKRLMRARYVALTLVALMAWSCTPAAPTPTETPSGVNVIEPPIPVRDFTLDDQTGSPRRLDELVGAYALITFGFTHCPDVCPANLAMFKLVKQELGADADQVSFVFVSVDPERDTPTVLAEHLALFDPAFVGLTGDEGALRGAAQDFGVTFIAEKEAPDQTAYSVTHTASTFLVGPGRELIRVYSFATDSSTIAEDIRGILNGTS